MARNAMTEKLDQLTIEDLGVSFDEGAVWSKLEQRLDNRKVYAYWWAVAACVLVSLLFLPVSLFRGVQDVQPLVSETVKIPGTTQEDLPKTVVTKEENITAKAFFQPTLLIEKKSISTPKVASFESNTLSLEKIPSATKKETKPAFAAEDISIIQASLERPSIEKGKKITVRAHLQSFPDQVHTNQKVLKIKLYEKH